MKKVIIDILPYILIIIAVVLLRTFVVTPVTVNGPSMQSTLYTGDVMLLNKYDKNKIERYDVVVILRNSERLVKRLIALPNETIECKNGVIYINGEEKSNEYGYGKSFDFDEIKLSDDEYFVIGDNRYDSLDSRYFGPVKKEQILGKTNFIVYPFNRFGKVA